MAEANLDALILALETQDDPPGVVVDVAPPELDQHVLPPDPGPGTSQEQQQQVPTSPVHVSPIIGKYISSSSAKRRAVKSTNCCFCVQNIDRHSMAEHLHRNERCMTLYSRKLHVKTVDSVLCLLFECLFCSERAPKLFIHLEKKEECKLRYMQKFNVLSSREAVDKVSKLRRTGYKSRRSLTRSIENVKAKKKRFSMLQNEPPETALNAHLHKTLFSNYKTCIGCLSHLTAAEEVTRDSDCVKMGHYSLEDKSYLKRFGKFWICGHCKSGADNHQTDTPMLEMTLKVEGDDVTFFPKKTEEEDEAAEIDDLPEMEDVSGRIYIMLPFSTECLKETPVDAGTKSLSTFQIQNLLYSEEPFSFGEASLLYQHQLLKFNRARNNNDLFFGKVESVQAKTLVGVKMCSQEKKIVGSNGWRKSQHQDLKWKRVQLGSFCLRLSVSVPIQNQPSIATHLTQKGRVLTATLQGDENGEMRRKYFVHTGSYFYSKLLSQKPYLCSLYF